MADNIQLNDPSGNLVDVDPDHAELLKQTGYSEPSPDQLAQQSEQEAYTTPRQQITAGLEGALQGVAPVVGTIAEQQLLGQSSEDIQKRQEYNPSTHLIGNIAGIAGNPLVGGAAAAAGEGAAALGVGRIGSLAVKEGIAGLAMQSGDEANKLLFNDPSQTLGSAAINMGLATLIGGGIGAGFGVASPLWESAKSGPLGQLLGAVRDRAGGAPVSDAMNDAIEQSGIQISPEVKAALSSDPAIKQMFTTLQESSTGSGLEAQQSLKTFKGQVADALISTFGKTPEDVAALEDLSPHEVGTAFKDQLTQNLNDRYAPLAKQFDDIAEQFKSVPLADADKSLLAENVAKATSKYDVSPSSPQAQMTARVLKEIPGLDSLESLRNYQSILNDTIKDPTMYGVGGDIRTAMRQAENDIIDRTLASTNPELQAQHAAARQGYAQAMQLVDSLNDRLHVGKYGGLGGFIRNLGEMTPEDVARRLSNKNDVDLLKLLNKDFPQTAEQVRNYHTSNLLKTASAKTAEGETISAPKLFTAYDKLSPEIKQFITSDPNKFSALRQLSEGLPNRMNNSGTGRTLDSLWKKVPGSAMAMASMLIGKNPVVGFLLGEAGTKLARDIPDAARLSYLRFLGSDAPISAGGFKSMAEYFNHALRGADIAAQAAKGVFSGSMPSGLTVSSKDRDKLDNLVQHYQENPQDALGVGGKLGHYLPDHASALGQMTATAVQYLSGIRPKESKVMPLDTTHQPSSAEQAQYDRALNIANQPLTVLSNIKRGNLIPGDIKTLTTIYPKLHEQLVQHLTNEMIERQSDNKAIPYTTRMGLSLFMGQPLDSTMTPQAIMAAQPAPQPQNPVSNAAPAGGKAQRKTSSLSKGSTMLQTPEQSRQMRANKP